MADLNQLVTDGVLEHMGLANKAIAEFVLSAGKRILIFALLFLLPRAHPHSSMSLPPQ
jgi:hypothetical protein